MAKRHISRRLCLESRKIPEKFPMGYFPGISAWLKSAQILGFLSLLPNNNTGAQQGG
jgi:hypothetical protein